MNIKFIIDDSYKWNNQLANLTINERTWSVRKDRDGYNMLFYHNQPAEEIIYCIGEISLALITSLPTLQEEYYQSGESDVFNIALRLIRNSDLASEFYEKYKTLSEKL